MGTYVRPEGDLKTAKLIIVGEQPGKIEIQSNRPFVGPAGIELNECLKAVGLTRNECYLTNYAKDLDAHVSEYLDLKTLTYSKKGKENQHLLFSELQQATSTSIIAMGQYAMTALTGISQPGITKWRGSILENLELPGKWIIPTLHTNTIIPPKMVYLNKFLIQLDLRRAKEISEKGYKKPNRNLITKPSFFDCLEYLAKLKAQGLNGSIVYFDIEIYNEEVSCISFALSEKEAISIPFVENEDYFHVDNEAEIWLKIAEILENPNIKKCGQNISFDAHFLLRRYGIKSKNLEDTMVAQRIIMPDYPIGLDFITSVWTDQKYYKDEGKKYFSGGGWEQLWKYNATDSLMCAEAFPKQRQKLREQENEEIYNEQVKLVPPLVYMQERGIRVDLEGMAKLAKDLEENIGTLQEELNSVAGQVLNANSPKQLQNYFYGQLKHSPYVSRTTGNVTTDDMAMKRLARKGVKEARLVQGIRKNRKLISTYLSPEKIDPDGRIRCSFNPAGTRFARLSSSGNIFGTGMNMQNWPHSLHKFLLFDEDYIGYRIDLSQAENRIVAYVGNVSTMIDCFERHDDVHSLTAGLILNKPSNEISDKEGSSPLGDGTHSEREWGKKANHGLNYDLGYRAFALLYEMPESQAKFMVEKYHLIYPGIRNNFHALVRQQLRRNRTVINLLGRRTLFMDAWGDSLFKDAYSCIPQGTVGDLINRYGINYLYYNTDFSPVELLLQVHDDITFQIPKYLNYDQHAKIVLQIKRNLEQTLTTFDGREFVIPADVAVCPRTFSKKDGKEFKSHKIPDDPILFAELIKSVVEG